MKEMIDILKMVAPEFPLLLVFLGYTVVFLVYLEKKDKGFQKFLSEQRKEFISVLRELSTSFKRHDESMTNAIIKMEERTAIREKEEKQ